MINKMYLWVINGRPIKTGTLMMMCAVVIVGVMLVASSCVSDGNGSRY